MFDLFEEYLKEQEEAVICADKKGVKIKGCAPMLMTKFGEIIIALTKCGFSKSDLQYAFETSFKSEKELTKELLEKMKDVLLNKENEEE